MTTTGRATTIVYPESDGMPLPDGLYQDPIFRRVVGALEVHFSDVENALVSGNTFLYYVEGNPRRNVSPDCYVVFGLSDSRAGVAFDRKEQHLPAVGSGQAAGLRDGDSLPEHVAQRPGRKARPVCSDRRGRVLALRPDRRRLLPRAAGGRAVGGRRISASRDAPRNRRFGVGAQRRAEPRPVVDRR